MIDSWRMGKSGNHKVSLRSLYFNNIDHPKSQVEVHEWWKEWYVDKVDIEKLTRNSYPELHNVLTDGNSRIIGIQQCAEEVSDIRTKTVTTKTEQGIKLNFSLISCRNTCFVHTSRNWQHKDIYGEIMKYQGVKEFHMLVPVSFYCKIIVFGSFKLEITYHHSSKGDKW